MGAVGEHAPVADAHAAGRRSGEPHRRGQKRIEHHLKVKGRTADDLEHVGGRGLLRERLLKVVRARLHFIEQAHILDRDDRLVGEGLQDLDLSRVERSCLGSPHHQRAFDPVVAQQGHACDGARAGERVHGNVEFAVLERVGDDFGLAGQQDPPRHRRPSGGRRMLREIPPHRRVPALGHRPISEPVAFTNTNRAAPAAAKRDGRGQQCLEHNIKIERRAADDLEHVRGRGLLRERLLDLAGARLHFVKHARVLDRDRGLVGEALGKRDFLLRKGPRRHAGDDDRPDAPILEQHRRVEHRDSAGFPHGASLVLGQVGLVGKIGKVKRAALGDGDAGRTAGERRHVAAPVSALPSALGHPLDHLPFDEVNGHRLEAEQPLTGLEDRLEDGRDVGDGAADHLEDVRGRGLLRERLLGLVEQPDIADCDHGLIRECLDKLNLPRREWLDPPAAQHDDANHLSIANERHAQSRALPGKAGRLH